MAVSDIEPGKKILCQELNSGKGYTGFFYIDEKTISAEICSYDEFFYLPPEKPVFLRTENNRIVSLYGNFSAPPASSARLIEPKMKTYKQRIVSSAAVIGHDRWEEGDTLKRVTFFVTRAKESLTHREKIETLRRRKIGDPYEGDLFSETVNDITVRARYAMHYSSGFHGPSDILPLVEIEFHNGAMLGGYVEAINCLLEFLSFSQGIDMKPSGIEISRLSGEELDAPKARAHPEDYAVEYVWPETPLDDLDRAAAGALASAWDDDDLGALRKCIAAWMARDETWRKANVMMMHCLASRREISGDRLIAACNWLAEIPSATWQTAITEEHINEIAEAAAQAASGLGYGKLRDRITGALKPIKTETNEERFLRLVRMVKQTFGPAIIDDRAVTDLRRAIDFRGRSAHGHFSPADESELRAFIRSIYAMEALCFLLTASELPINAPGIKRAHSHPFVRNYRLG
jgi:hypothetical protein